MNQWAWWAAWRYHTQLVNEKRRVASAVEVMKLARLRSESNGKRQGLWDGVSFRR